MCSLLHRLTGRVSHSHVYIVTPTFLGIMEWVSSLVHKMLFAWNLKHGVEMKNWFLIWLALYTCTFSEVYKFRSCREAMFLHKNWRRGRETWGEKRGRNRGEARTQWREERMSERRGKGQNIKEAHREIEIRYHIFLVRFFSAWIQPFVKHLCFLNNILLAPGP